MGHAQLATTELYAHHVPKRNAATALTEFVNAQKQAESVQRSVPRTAENQDEQPAPLGMDRALAATAPTPRP
jgi:hypothetical protein